MDVNSKTSVVPLQVHTPPYHLTHVLFKWMTSGGYRDTIFGMTIQRFHLKNGVPLFVVENHASPVVSIQAWVSRGSVYESEKVAGISHFLEHALFKGTKRRKVGEIALEVEKRGGEINAFTSYEETCYYTTMASRFVEDGIDIITDAIQNPSFDADEMLREREVILEEIKRAQDSPHKVLVTNLWKAAFPNTPYGRPVLGFTDTVSKINHVTLKKYFDSQYHTGSISFIIVGDVNAQKIKSLVEKKTSKMRKGKKAQISFKLPNAKKKVTVLASDRDVQECELQIAWITPNIKDSIVPPLDLLCTALGQGESSRLYQTLVKEKKVALQAHMGLAATAECGLATISLEVAPENLEAAISETFKLLESVAKDGLFEKEVERVKSALESEVVAGKETVEGYARRLGYYYVQFGDPEYEKKYLEAILSTSRAEAQDSISHLLTNRPVVSIVHPKNFKLDSSKIAAFMEPKAKKAAVTPKHIPTLQMKTHGSIRVIEKQLTDLPIVSLKIIFPGGAREEKNGQIGLGNLFQRTWASGTHSFSSLEMAHRLESLGAAVSSFCGKHTMGLSVEFLSKHWPLVKPIVHEMLTCPTFPEEEVNTERELLLRDILSERDTPGAVCQLNLLEALYGTHPYARSGNGKKEDVAKFRQSDLKDFFNRFIHRKSVIVSTVGNFDPLDWSAEIVEMLEKLPANGDTPRDSLEVKDKNTTTIITAQKEPLFQSHVMIGFLSAAIKDRESYGLKLLSSALSGQGGRLFLELRDKQSLAYSVAPIHSLTPDRGFFAFYIGCSPEKLSRSITGIRTELDKVLNQVIGPKELARAKEYWIGRFELDLQRYGSQAMLYALDEMYGLGFDHYKEAIQTVKDLSAEDILKAAQKYLSPEKATLSIVHREKLEEAEVKELWLGGARQSAGGKSPREKLVAATH